MFSYMDSTGFYVFYLILILVLLALCIAFYMYQKKGHDIFILERFLRILLIISLTIFILDSIPYIFLDKDQIPLINIILSNIFLAILCSSTIFYELTLYCNNDQVSEELK